MAATVTANLYSSRKGLNVAQTAQQFVLGIRRNGQYVNYIAVDAQGEEFQVGSYYAPRKSSRMDYPANHPVAAWEPVFVAAVKNNEPNLPRAQRPAPANVSPKARNFTSGYDREADAEFADELRMARNAERV